MRGSYSKKNGFQPSISGFYQMYQGGGLLMHQKDMMRRYFFCVLYWFNKEKWLRVVVNDLLHLRVVIGKLPPINPNLKRKNI